MRDPSHSSSTIAIANHASSMRRHHDATNELVDRSQTQVEEGKMLTVTRLRFEPGVAMSGEAPAVALRLVLMFLPWFRVMGASVACSAIDLLM